MQAIEQKYQVIRGGRMTKFKGRVASCAAMAASVIAISATGALAATIDTYTTADYEVDFDEAFVVGPNGEIDVSTDSYGAAAIYYLGNSGDFVGSIEIEGDVTLNGDENGYSVGIEIQEDLAGSITNNGEVYADREDDSDYGDTSADGIYISGSVLGTGSITNNDEITAYAYSDYYDAYAGGITVNQDVDGVITNAGSITVEADAEDGAMAAGIIVWGDLDGDIYNDGEIGVTAEADGYYEDAEAAGIFVSGDVGVYAHVVNSGDIEVSATAWGYEGNADATGIYAENFYGVLNSDGDINVTSYSDYDYGDAYANGIVVDGELSGGTIEVNGDFDISAESQYGYAYAEGVSVDENTTFATIDLAGEMTVEAISHDENAYAYGVRFSDLDSSDLTNDGLIDVSAEGYYGGAAYGAFISQVDYNSEVVNNGTIIATATDTDSYSGAYNDGYGIYVDSDVVNDALVENNGEIYVEVTSDTDSYLNGVGILIDSDIADSGSSGNAMVVNNGLIDVFVEKDTNDYYSSNDVWATGMYVADNIGEADATGTLSNGVSGQILIEVSNSNGYAYATGMGVNNDLGDGYDGYGYIYNDGLIEIDAFSEDNGGTYAVGIEVDGNLVAGGIYNDGHIAITAGSNEEYYSTEAYGIYVDDYMNGGEIVNGGNSIEIDIDTDGYGYAYGIYIGRSVYDATISNDGAIMIDVNGDNYAWAAGIRIEDYVASDVTLENTESGAISVYTYSYNNNAYAVGIDVDGSMSGELLNDGAIYATASSREYYSETTGISVDGELYGSLINTGLIDVYGEADDNAAVAGIYTYHLASGGMLVNDGMIEADADGGSEEVFGIYVDYIHSGGVVVNNGTIMVSADEEPVGIYVGENDGDVVNNGVIMAGTDGFAIVVGSSNSDGTVTINPDSFIEGMIDANDSEVVLVSGPSTSSVYYILNDDNVVLDDSEGTPWFTDGEGTYASFDPTAAAGMVATGSTVAALGFGSLFDNIGTGGAGVTQGLGTNGGFWVSGSRSSISYAGDGVSTLDYDTSANNFAAGYSTDLTGVTSLGVMVGGANGNLSADGAVVGSADTSFNGAYVGVGIEHNAGGASLTFGLAGGRFAHDSERTINNAMVSGGVEVATAEYDSTWFSPYLGVAYDINAGNGLRVTPSASFQYISQRVGAYEEEGAEAAIAVDAFSVGVTQIEGELEVGYTVGAGEVTGSVGFLNRSVNSGEMDVTLLGDTQALGYDGLGFNAVTAGIGFNSTFGSGGSIDIGADFVFGDDVTETGVNLSATVGFKF